MSEVNISAADVKNLREQTGAGMMDCKKALAEANGDFEKAIEILRLQGQKLSLKRADRDAKEGVVIALVNADQTKGIVLRVSCETDFVAKNEDFVGLAGKILDLAISKKPADLEALKALPLENSTAGGKVTEYMGIIGEKLELAYYEKIEAPYVQAYIHPGNKLSSLAGFSKAGLSNQVYKDVVMQIAAMNPVAIDKDDVPAKAIEQELEIGREQARREGKPEDMIDRIAQGKLAKFYKESTLLNQEFVKDNKMNIRQYLESVDKQLKITAFKRYNLNQ